RVGARRGPVNGHTVPQPLVRERDGSRSPGTWNGRQLVTHERELPGALDFRIRSGGQGIEPHDRSGGAVDSAVAGLAHLDGERDVLVQVTAGELVGALRGLGDR